MVCAFAGAICAQANDSKNLQDSLMAMEKQAWEAFGKGDGKFFESFLTDDFQMVSDSGISGKAQSVQMISTKPCDLKSFSFSNPKLSMLNKTTALVTYEATQDVSCGGQQAPGKAYLSSIFVKRGGKWLAMFHQESTAAPMK